MPYALSRVKKKKKKKKEKGKGKKNLVHSSISVQNQCAALIGLGHCTPPLGGSSLLLGPWPVPFLFPAAALRPLSCLHLVSPRLSRLLFYSILSYHQLPRRLPLKEDIERRVFRLLGTTAMDSLPSHHFHLAQMPTDHPEHEHHHPLAIMGSSSPADGILQVNASQPYDPCPSIENWARFRSNPASEPLMPLLQSGYTNLWSSAAAEPYELSPTHLPPSYLDSFYSTSTTAPIMTSPSSMGHLSPGLNPHHDSEDQLSPVKVETITSPSFNPETFYHHRAQLEMPGSDFLAEPSPPFANTDKSLLSLSQESIRPVMTAPATESTSSRRTVWGNSEETYGSDPPYSELIYQALKSAPDMKLSLQGVYSWFERNTTKGKDQKKGWQNSIRHNLSMNAVRAHLWTFPCISFILICCSCFNPCTVVI